MKYLKRTAFLQVLTQGPRLLLSFVSHLHRMASMVTLLFYVKCLENFVFCRYCFYVSVLVDPSRRWPIFATYLPLAGIQLHGHT